MCGKPRSTDHAPHQAYIQHANYTAADVHALLRETATAAAAREWRESGASSQDVARAAYISILRRRWGCTVALAGARLRLSRAYLVGGDRDDHDAADAGGVAAGFDFGDAARMAAEFAPVLGGAPAAGSVAIRLRARARARARTRTRVTRARAHACSHLLACLLAFASMSCSFALLVPLE